MNLIYLYNQSLQIETLLNLTDNSYSYGEIIKMELLILKKMHFNVMMPNVEDFKNRYVRASLLDSATKTRRLKQSERTEDLKEVTFRFKSLFCQNQILNNVFLKLHFK